MINWNRLGSVMGHVPPSARRPESTTSRDGHKVTTFATPEIPHRAFLNCLRQLPLAAMVGTSDGAPGIGSRQSNIL